MDGNADLLIGPIDGNITTIGWIAVKFCTDIHGSQRMKPNDVDDLLAFHPCATSRSNLLFIQCNTSICA